MFVQEPMPNLFSQRKTFPELPFKLIGPLDEPSHIAADSPLIEPPTVIASTEIVFTVE